MVMDLTTLKRISEAQLMQLAWSLINGDNANCIDIHPSDARAVWAIVCVVTQWRKSQNIEQPKPKGYRTLSPAKGRDVLVQLGMNPNRIVSEILTDPLMMAILCSLAAGLKMVWPTAPRGMKS